MPDLPERTITMPGFRLDEEQRARVRDCLQKDNIAPQGAVFERLLLDIESSISPRYRAQRRRPRGTAALRAIWVFADEDDPPVRVLRGLVKALPKPAVDYIDRRAPRTISKLFPADPFEGGTFLAWADKASGDKFVQALRVLSADGGQIVAGRSRGRGKRSSRRLEPVIFGEARGAGTKWRKGGRPSEGARHELVMHLAVDWLRATGQMARPGRRRAT